MSLELLNTLGTLITVAIIAATAIAAMVQLRHLRAGNQINAMLSISNQFDEKEFRDAFSVVVEKAESTLDDPAYREYVVSVLRHQPVPAMTKETLDVAAAIRLVANTYEELGILVKNGIVDKTLFLDRYAFVILRTWRRMEGTVAWTRAVADQTSIWENFEYLTVLSEDYMREHPTSYPQGVRRLTLHNPWPVPPMPATA
jgi:hypothetical protein